MLDHQVRDLSAACESFDVPAPAAVIAAADRLAVIEAAAEKIAGQTAPGPLPDDIDVRGVLAWVDTRLDAARRDAQLAEVRALVKAGERAVAEAWATSTAVLFDAFAGPFDGAVVELTASLDGHTAGALPLPGSDTYQRMDAAAQQVDRLDRMHQALTGAGDGPDRLDGTVIRMIRTLQVPSRDHYARRLRILTDGQPWHSPQWYATVLAAGCRLRWATLAEIADEWKHTPAVSPTTTASAVA